MGSLFSLLLQVIQSIHKVGYFEMTTITSHESCYVCLYWITILPMPKTCNQKIHNFFLYFCPCQLYVQLARKKKYIYNYIYFAYIVCNNITYYIVFYILSWGYVLVSSWMHFLFISFHPFFKWTVNCQHIILYYERKMESIGNRSKEA